MVIRNSYIIRIQSVYDQDALALSSRLEIIINDPIRIQWKVDMCLLLESVPVIQGKGSIKVVIVNVAPQFLCVKFLLS